MPTQEYDFGMIGLGTMGRNLVYNMCDYGYSVAGFDIDNEKAKTLEKEAEGKAVLGVSKIEDFIKALKSPRIIMLLVPAGPVVDAVIADLKPYLKADDLVMDCGNSHFTDTDARIKTLAKENIHLMGVGISGGEYGARYGPSIMPGGAKTAYKKVEEMLTAISAKVNGEPCVTWIGPGAAGHYVKMVHNGIEYALMQLLAEAYHLLKESGKLDNQRLHEVFSNWNKGRLQSYLMEITADIFAQQDVLTSNSLVDMILDKSKQNGTGQWTSQSALSLHVTIPNIDAAVTARDLSSLKDERIAAQKKLDWFEVEFMDTESELINWLEDTLYFSMIVSYAQGFALLNKASDEYGYHLNLADIATIWRGGCIIRSALLEDITDAYTREPELLNLLVNDALALKLETCQDSTRLVVKTGVDTGVPMPVMMASLAYYDGYRRSWLPANLIQAQRDYFGAHTYERIDREGVFHTKWTKE